MRHSKETHTRNLYTRPVCMTLTETCERDLQKRHINETCKRNTHKRPIHKTRISDQKERRIKETYKRDVLK